MISFFHYNKAHKSIRFVFLAILHLVPAWSQTNFEWRSSAANGNWSGSNHWWIGSESGPGFGVMRFNNNHQLNMTNDISGTFGTHAIHFRGANSETRTINGNPIRLFDFGGAAGSSPYILNTSTATHILNVDLNGGVENRLPLLIRLDNSGGLIFNGTLNNRENNINVQGTTSSANTVNFNGVISGPGGFFQTNSNITSIFNAVNTYTGTNTIEAGTIRLGQTGASFGGDESAVRLGAAGVMDLNGHDTTVRYVSERGTGDGGTVTLGGATLTIRDTGSNTRFQSSINGAGNLVYDSNASSSTTLYSSQGYTGSTTVRGGILSSSGAMQTSSVVIEGGSFILTGNDNRLAADPSVNLTGGTFNPRTNESIHTLTASGGTIDIQSGTTLILLNGGSFGSASSLRNGTLRVSGGSLMFNSTDVNNSTALTIDEGTTFRGTGTVGGNTSVSGTHRPGNSPGIQSFTGDLSYEATSVFAWDIDYALDASDRGTRGTQFSGVNVGGNLVISEGAEFRIVTNQPIDFDGDFGTGFWGQNHVWNDIFAVTGSITGSFGSDSFVNVYDSEGALQDISLIGTFSVNGTTLSYTAIPEPGTLFMAALVGLASVITARRHRFHTARVG